MVKKAILLMSAAVCLSGAAMAQTQLRCYTDEVNAELKARYPDVAKYEAELEQQIQRKLNAMDLRRFAKTTADDTIYLVPIVFHVIHNYGQEYITDNLIYESLAGINRMYSKSNPDTVEVIPPYKGNIPGSNQPYIGNARIRFVLPTKDPNGNPTRGITRRRSYLTSNAGDQAKFDLWPPDAYLNIWIVQKFNSAQSSAAAYAYKPAGAASNPYSDGVISLYSYINQDNTLSHEIGHSLNLDHPWGGTNQPEVECGDDAVDDTPPTWGHNVTRCSAAALSDTTCSYKFVTIGRAGIPASLIPKPDASSIRGIDFVARQNLTIDALTIYPTAAVGTPFTILLRQYGDVVDSFSGTVTSNVGAQVVPVDFSVPADSGYFIVFRKNPNALRDTIISPYRKRVTGVIELKNDNTALKYNYFYDWQISYGANRDTSVGKPSVSMTADRATGRGITFKSPAGILIRSVDIYPTDTIGAPFTIELNRILNSTGALVSTVASYSGNTTVAYAAQNVTLDFNVPARGLYDSFYSYKLVFSQNPAAMRDTPTSPYMKDVAGAINVIEDQTAGKYNYFYNMTVRHGYFKIYSATKYDTTGALVTYDSLVNYPDTVNSQNVMDYTYCSKMFTHGQVERMRAALTSPIAGRRNLISGNNLNLTGILLPKVDLPPVADFSLVKTTSTLADRQSVDKVFGCANSAFSFGFEDRSWNDTIIARSWSFSNGATPATAATANVNGIKFMEPGWVTVSLTATGNNSGSTTVTRKAVYAADPNPTSALGYFQEFNPEGDVDKWPSFNYFENDFKWEVVNNAGFYDNYSIRYKNYDTRMTIPAFLTGTPQGDYDDFFTPVFDLSAPEYNENCNLNFMYAGAFRTTNPAEMTDSLEIFYSTDCGSSWSPVRAPLMRAELGNNGTLNSEFKPGWMGAWKLQSINLPAAARTAKTIFRFRYKPGVFVNNLIGSGNNFYMDRIHISNFPTGIDGEMLKSRGMVLSPNPTHGGAQLIVEGLAGTVQVQVTDVTGKVVYRVEALMNQGINRIEIPASSISVKGMYMVQLVSGNKTQTEKLIVY